MCKWWRMIRAKRAKLARSWPPLLQLLWLCFPSALTEGIWPCWIQRFQCQNGSFSGVGGSGAIAGDTRPILVLQGVASESESFLAEEATWHMSHQLRAPQTDRWYLFFFSNANWCKLDANWQMVCKLHRIFRSFDFVGYRISPDWQEETSKVCREHFYNHYTVISAFINASCQESTVNSLLAVNKCILAQGSWSVPLLHWQVALIVQKVCATISLLCKTLPSAAEMVKPTYGTLRLTNTVGMCDRLRPMIRVQHDTATNGQLLRHVAMY